MTTTYLHTSKGYSVIPIKENIDTTQFVNKLITYCNTQNNKDENIKEIFDLIDIDKYKKETYGDKIWNDDEDDILGKHITKYLSNIIESYLKDIDIFAEDYSNDIIKINAIPKEFNKSYFGNYYEYGNGINLRIPFTSYEFTLPYTSSVNYHNPDTLFIISKNKQNLFKNGY